MVRLMVSRGGGSEAPHGSHIISYTMGGRVKRHIWACLHLKWADYFLDGSKSNISFNHFKKIRHPWVFKSPELILGLFFLPPFIRDPKITLFCKGLLWTRTSTNTCPYLNFDISFDCSADPPPPFRTR